MFPRESTSQPQLRFETLRFGNRVDWDKDWDAQEVQCNRFQLFCKAHGLGSKVSDQGIELDYAIPMPRGGWEE
jgi:hypothetical protein